jgi:hypothetical protein
MVETKLGSLEKTLGNTIESGVDMDRVFTSLAILEDKLRQSIKAADSSATLNKSAAEWTAWSVAGGVVMVILSFVPIMAALWR